LKLSTRAALLSGLVLPGLGQYLNGQRVKAGVIMTAITVLVLALGGRIFSLVYQVLAAATAPGSLILIPSKQTLAEIHRRAYSENGWLLLLIVSLWLYSIGDAYWNARRKERARPPVSH